MSKADRIYPHIHKGRFYNHAGEKRDSVFLRSCAMYMAGLPFRSQGVHDLEKWHQQLLEQPRLEQQGLEQRELEAASFHNVLVVPPLSDEDSFKITWIGHATFLIQWAGYTILTDPLFGDLTFLFQRLRKPGIALDSLPVIDAVIISHNHWDHMDKLALQAIARQSPHCTFFVPQGDRHWLQAWGIDRVVESLWWDAHILNQNNVALRAIFLPANHWSQRSLFDFNRSLWGSWMIEIAGRKLYFAGDTAAGKHFEQIAQEHGPIEYALMPIGPCEPKSWMKKSHLNVEDSVEAFSILGAQHFFPMHWGTFHFGTDAPLLPIERIQTFWPAAGSVTCGKELHVLRIGQTKVLPIEAPLVLQKSILNIVEL